MAKAPLLRREQASGVHGSVVIGVVPVVGQKEMGLVLLERAPHGGAVLPLLEGRLRQVQLVLEEGLPVQTLVPAEDESAAVEVVGAALGDDVHDAAGGAAELRVVALGPDLVLPDCPGRELL